jgi:hypothetical protein
MDPETATRCHEFESIELTGAESLNPNISTAAQQIRENLMLPTVTKDERKKARQSNQQKFDLLQFGLVYFILGATGTGKTTTFMRQFVTYFNPKETDKNILESHAKRKGILVLPTNAAVENAAESAIAIFKTEFSSSEIEMNCIIFQITEINKKGWQAELERLKKHSQFKSTLVIVNASFFASTMSYWFNHNFDIMIDEPDDKCNSATSPTAILALEFFHRKSMVYNIPVKGRNESALNFLKRLSNYYIEMGFSYNATIEKGNDANYHINNLKALMQNYKGKFCLSSATMPNWLLKAVDVLGLKSSIIEMEKPSNPRLGVYQEHFDAIIKRCIQEGNMTDVYNPLCETILQRIIFLRGNEKEFEKNCKGDTLVQMKGFREILVVLPGMNEVHNFTTENLDSYLSSRTIYVGQFVIITPNNIGYAQRELETKVDAIVIRVVPYHMGRGLNYNTATIFVGPFRRVRNDKGSITELTVDLCDLADCNQIEGRGGRLGPCTIFRLGSKKTFESLKSSNEFYAKGMEQTIMGLVSHGLHQNHFAAIAELYDKATGSNPMHIMMNLILKKFVEIGDDEHYHQSRTGQLYNIYHDSLPWYIIVEEFFRKNNCISQENIFKMNLWMQLYSNMTNGKNTLFDFPENQGLRKSMRESRIEIEITCGVANIDSHFILLWHMTNYIYETTINEFKGDMTSLYRYSTFNERSVIGQFARNAHIDVKTLRLCCVNALNQLCAVMDRGLLENLPGCVENEFSFNDFVIEKSMKDLSSGEIVIATIIHEDNPKENQRIYAGSDGKTYMVYYDMIAPCNDASVIVVVKSVVKPDMLKRKVALATVVLPMTVLAQVGNMYDLMLSKIDIRFVQIVRDWLQSDNVEPPFEFIDTIENTEKWFDVVFRTLLGENIILHMVDPLIFNLLMSIKNMRQTMISMTNVERQELYTYFNRMFREHTLEMLSKGGASMTKPYKLPKALVNVGGADGQNLNIEIELDTNKSSAFIPYTVITFTANEKRGFNKIRVKAKRLTNEELEKRPNFQRLNSMVPMELDAIIQERVNRYVRLSSYLPKEAFEGFTQEHIVPRHVCPMCRKTDNHDNRITAVFVQEKNDSDHGYIRLTDMHGVVMIYHAQCLLAHLNDLDFAEFCPFTGGRMFDIGINGIPMDNTFEDRMGDIKSLLLTENERYDHIRTFLVANFTNVNNALNNQYTLEMFMDMSIDELRKIHNDYGKILDEEKEKVKEKSKAQARINALKKIKEEQNMRKAKDALFAKTRDASGRPTRKK